MAGLFDAGSSPYLSPAAFAFYGAILVALIGSIAAPFVQAKVQSLATERLQEIEAEAETAREREATAAWLRGQVDSLQAQVENLRKQLAESNRRGDRLQRAVRDQEADAEAYQRRVTQLEGIIVAAGHSVPDGHVDYQAAERRRRRRES